MRDTRKVVKNRGRKRPGATTFNLLLSLDKHYAAYLSSHPEAVRQDSTPGGPDTLEDQAFKVVGCD